MKNRREFIKKAALGSIMGLGVAGEGHATSHLAQIQTGKGFLRINEYLQGKMYNPMDPIQVVSSTPGVISVADSKGRTYYTSGSKSIRADFKVAGALGVHTLSLTANGKIVDNVQFVVDCKTQISDSQAQFKELLDMAYWTALSEMREFMAYRIDGRIYIAFVSWLRDHTHTMKFLKYFYPVLKDAFDLYAKYQREDGLVWDNLYVRNYKPNWWDTILGKDKGDFIRVVEGGKYEFKRQPIEADMEYIFTECLYYTWKATGDTYWMSKGIDKALKAMQYAMTDIYRWSEKYQLVKRGFTIDTWDFVHEYDFEKTGYGSGQCIDPQKNDFGIMHGDNTGMYIACLQLAEMLDVLDRKTEAENWLKIGQGIKSRLDTLAWNGNFYTHYIPEKEDFWERHDIGNTDRNKQLSLSNAYALNRGISHEQAVKIIESYLQLKNNLPKGSPGEWVSIYPIFEKGFGKDSGHYEYVNGGVLTIVAGELAHGAFEHGYETYGADILKRVAKIGKKHRNYLHCTLKGAKIEPPKANFTTISLRAIANADFSAQGAKGVPGWSGEGPENDLKNMPLGLQTFRDIPFDITDPATNGRKGALILSNSKGYISKATLTLKKKAKTLYLLHARSRESMVGYVTLNYSDGTSFTDYILDGKIDNWWYPSDRDQWKVAFSVPNGKSMRVGMGIYGLSNPKPDKEITSVVFELLKDNSENWYIGALTLSDQDPYFDPGDVSFGIPDSWGAAAVGYGLVEGLAGIKDLGIAFDKVLIAPRWEAASENSAQVCIKYEASGAYISYNYSKSNSYINMDITGSGNSAIIEILLPKDKTAGDVYWDGNKVKFDIKKVEKSVYVTLQASLVGLHQLKVSLV